MFLVEHTSEIKRIKTHNELEETSQKTFAHNIFNNIYGFGVPGLSKKH